MIGGLCTIGIALGLAVLLRHVPWATFGIAWWSITTQLIGALVAFGGLLYAYARATAFWSRVWPRVTRLWARLLGKPVGVDLHVSGGVTSVATSGADFIVGFRLDRTLSIEDQLTQLENYVNGRLTEKFLEVLGDISQLRRDIEAVRSQSDSAAKQVLADAKAEIESLAGQLDRSQVLDLRWAALGLFITAIGIALSYGA